MLAACLQHATTLIRTGTPGVYCRGSRYVAVTLRRGRQHKTFHHTLAEAREARSDRSGRARPAPQTRQPFDTYARAWVEDYQGRTRRGFDEDTRKSYRRALELYAIPHFGATPLREIDRESVGGLVGKLQRGGSRRARSPSTSRLCVRCSAMRSAAATC
jgi:hypothetical protein